MSTFHKARTFAFACATLLVLLAAPPPANAVNCEKNPSHPNCPQDPGPGGSEKIASKTTYGASGGIRTDGMGTDELMEPHTYRHGDPTVDDLRVFIGDGGANLGNIFQQFGVFPATSDRTMLIDFTNPIDAPNGACGILDNAVPGALTEVAPQFANADINSENGLYDLANIGDQQFGNMVIRFRDPLELDDSYVLRFGSVGGKSPCKGQWAEISAERTKTVAADGEDEWTMTIHENANDLVCLEKAKKIGGSKAENCGTYHLPTEFTLRPCSAADDCPPVP